MAELSGPRIIEHIHKSLNWSAYDAKWVPNSARFVSIGYYSRGSGAIQIYTLKQGKIEMTVEKEKKAMFKCCTFEATSPEERKLATGDIDGNMQVWDLEHMATPVYNVKAHDDIVNAIDGCGYSYGPPELCTASRDGCVRVWDIRQKEKPVVSLEPDEGEQRRDCWAVAFGNAYNDEERVIACGYENGDLKLFDLRTNTLRWETNIKNGICSLEFDRKDIQMNKLLATTLEGRFTVFDMRTFHPEKGYASLTEKIDAGTVWCGKHSPHNRDIFMIGSGSGLCQLYKYSYPSQRRRGEPAEGVPGTVALQAKTNISTQPIHSWDWNKSKEGLAVCTALDQALRVCIVTKLDKL
jgi:WD40 repeat protein